ncbi:hypothetical protein [Pseudorhodoferax sp.]|uniref:hypothetical protein n=1 Tax=Pseudorhodoferax sp. TaxID=1993553 RepID=UPI0039E2AC61
MDFDATEQVNELARRPADPPSVIPQGKWNGWSAPLRGLAAGAAEMAAFGADALKGYGQVEAAAGARAGGMFSAQTEAERQESEQEAARIRAEGVDADSEIGRSLRNVGEDYRPDPATAGLAERLVFDLTRFLGKAVGYTATTGPAGPLMLGADEAMVTSDDLQRQGVDRQTAQAAGAISGVAAAAGVVMPVAAPGSVAKTLGLWAAGGPGAFIAQQVATRELLAEADYGEISQQFDPLDPVGLALSSLVPGAFAIHAVRGARARVTPEQVDALMTHDLTLQQDVREATPPADRRMDPSPEDLARMEPREPLAQAGDISRHPDQVDAAMQSVLARADALEAAAPDMVVSRSEDGTPTTVSQALENIRRQAQEGSDTELGAQDASLLDVAVQCALATGQAA